MLLESGVVSANSRDQSPVSAPSRTQAELYSGEFAKRYRNRYLLSARLEEAMSAMSARTLITFTLASGSQRDSKECQGSQRDSKKWQGSPLTRACHSTRVTSPCTFGEQSIFEKQKRL